jgi:lipopolysaccharide transport system ATP-binding protein
MDTVISVQNVSKQYRLGQVGTQSIAHDINRLLYKLRGKEDPYLKVGDVNNRASAGTSDYVWALRDLNFEIKRGDTVGIIGKNGAGKSTLLKLLSRVTAPTIGNIEIKGRLAPLLEVGTGFHPELTGKENIYLNGAILGMTKKEIKAKFDEIVWFSGVERYIDTPVKRYSSGMYVRLAFAVAAHLESEILIVDEALAVGDLEFQKKCLGKMKDVSEDGRTVLFVSHSMPSIQSLCKHAMWMEYGSLKQIGPSEEIIDNYTNHQNILASEATNYWQDSSFKESDVNTIKIVSIKVEGESGDATKMGDDLICKMRIFVAKTNPSYQIGITLMNSYGLVISKMFNIDYGVSLDFKEGYNDLEIVIKRPNLLPGVYKLNFGLVYAFGIEVYDKVEDAISFDYEINDVLGTGIPLTSDRGIKWYNVSFRLAN